MHVRLDGLMPAASASPTEGAAPEGDDPQVIWSLVGGILPEARAGNAYQFNLAQRLTPIDLDQIDWSATGLPNWLALNSSTGVLSGTPAVTDGGNRDFAVTASRLDENRQVIYTITVGGIPLDVVQISAGDAHTCAVTSAGAAKCWGSNANGQLGDNTTTDRHTPVTVRNLGSGVKSITAGGSHTCAVTTSGAARCWGMNDYGQLGDGTTTDRRIPVTVSGLSNGVSTISTGGWHSCAVTTTGATRCWGLGTLGRLGDGMSLSRHTPVAVTGLESGVKDISLGSWHSCAATTAGAVHCWGSNGFGQLGDGTTTNRLSPVRVGVLSSVTHISVGHRHGCAVNTAGAARCWGDNGNAQLGDGTRTHRFSPVVVSGMSGGVASISAGTNHTCAATTGGVARCWGNNANGQLGDSTTTQRFTPANVIGLDSSVSSISAGSTHTCAIGGDGKGICWGRNSQGQLGNGTLVDSLVPDYIAAGE
jgi:alpha-tubulin suppressor-like RCC1 family protein